MTKVIRQQQVREEAKKIALTQVVKEFTRRLKVLEEENKELKEILKERNVERLQLLEENK